MAPRARVLLAVFTFTVAATAVAARAQDGASSSPERPVIVAFYEQKDLPEILGAARSHGIGVHYPLYCGTYGISKQDSSEVHELPLGHYAPLFTLVRDKDSIWNGRPGEGDVAAPDSSAATSPVSSRTSATTVAAAGFGFAQRLEGTEVPGPLTEAQSGIDSPLADARDDQVVDVALAAPHGPLGGFGETAEEAAEAQAARPDTLTGPVPDKGAFAKLPASERFAWAVEVGRRFRDEIRSARRAGVQIDTWQFDEISPSAADPIKGPPVRLFARGVLEGLFQGRRELGDRPLPGIAYISNTAFQLGQQPLTQEMTALWSTIDRTCFRFVGEEYPTFRGDPAAAAEHEARLQLGLEKLGGPAARVAAKYAAGNSPGYILGEFLGGDVASWPRAQVNMWRTAYLEARARQGVSGFGEYDFLKENEAPDVFRDTFSSIEATEITTR